MARRKASTDGSTKAQVAADRAAQKAEAGELIAKDGRRMSAASVRNLRPGKPFDEMDADKVREIRQEGQRESVKAQKKRRTIRDIYSDLLQLPADLESTTPDDLAEAAHQMAHQKGQVLTVYDTIAVAMAARARAGDVKAAAFVRDSAGDKPTDQVAVTDAITDGDRALLAKLSAGMADQDTD